MRWTRYFIQTIREEPADADVVSQKLMMRAAMIRKVAAGIYTVLPLGLRSIRKLEAIVRDEMNRSGAAELLMPAIQPAELWQRSGRWSQYGKELLRIRDRHDRDFLFGPTHEEVITDTVRDSVSSYRQLPLNLYQIQTKFRDEVRPRFGLMRAREFIMKDAYSFHDGAESLEETYARMRDAYGAIFRRCGLDHVMVEADTGNIGGSASHEFMVLAQSGEDVVLRCPSCGYGANVEKAVSTLPAATEGDEPQSLTVVETPATATIADVAKLLALEESALVKTLVFRTGKGPVMVLVRGDREANAVKIRNYLGVDEIELLEPSSFEKVVGGPMGFCGPVGTPCPRVIADESLRERGRWTVGANQRDRHYRGAVRGRDFDLSEFADFTLVGAGDPCRTCGTPLEQYRGIEVGHIFKLGTKYSESMGCTFLDEAGERRPMIMGCYGLGIGRTVAASIEQSHDADGIIWPVALAPFEAVVIAAGREPEVLAAAEKAYAALLDAGVDVLFDDRDERPGIKFKDADLIGFPFRVVVGTRNLTNGQIEWSSRRDKQKRLGTPAEVVRSVIDAVVGSDARA
ncbi:MAG TPA: proline--tRNA ligase [Thermoanaerobaculia bacterium]|nr:proline--tRNA ligase [Thermoanaerobaculia bacterium]